MRPLLIVFLLFAAFTVLSGCGSMAPLPDSAQRQNQARPGKWSLQYRGDCAGREAEPIDVSRLDESELVFDGFHLRKDETGHYQGSADFIAPMPADGRDVVYTVAYRLSMNEDGIFVGVETITEGGGHSLGCPVELVFTGGA